MKKLLLSTLLLALPLLASAYDCQVDGIYYNLKPGNQAEVTQVNDYVEANPSNYSGAVVIPEKFNYKGVMYTVTSIGEYAFYDCWNLVSVTIPNSVIIIETGAFNGCSGLTSVTIPNSVTSIGDYAFSYCTGLTSVTIPNSVTSISNSAFESCSRLTSVTIPNSVTSIGDYAFSYCTDMTSVTIPNSVTTIGEYAFCSCVGLTSVHITDIAAWCKISFGSNPLENACHLFLNGEEIKDLVIPNSVTAIGDHAFNFCTGLTSVTIPNSVTTIGFGAFYGCTDLTSVTIPNSVTTIGDGAFNRCYGLTSVTIPNSVTSIGNSVFNLCTGLTSVTIPNSVTTIGGYAFNKCTGLTSVTIPNSVTSIGEAAFSGCTGLTSVTIPNSVTTIEAYAFSYSTGLTSVISKMENPCHINDDCFPTDVFYNATLYVPEGTVDKYKSTDYWNKFVYTEESDPTDIIQVSSDDLLISAQNGTITVRGEQDGLPLTVYSADGKLLGSATTKDGQASISTNLQRGEIAIVKVGSKSVKIKM